jgi:hypothetical protein
LIPHLRTLIIRFGATEAIGQPRDYLGTPLNKLRLFRAEGISTDLVFVHRDADRSGADRRGAGRRGTHRRTRGDFTPRGVTPLLGAKE